jgi:6-phosphogluconolactonase (cycloisomerase 2 family)
MHRFLRIFSILVVPLWAGFAVGADDEKNAGRLKLVESVVREDLNRVVCVAFSPDGLFVYASAWMPPNLTVFARDPKTGKLDHKQTLTDDALAGATSVAISHDGKLAVAAAFQSKAVALFSRDAKTGQLRQTDIARDGENGVTLAFPVEAAFSPDSRFVYILDDVGPAQGGAIAAFRVSDSKLVFSSTDEGKDGCYSGARGIAFRPDGKTIFVASDRPGALVAADRDPETGKTRVLQVIKDDIGEVHGLAGAMGVALSPEGRFVYVSAGRFQGDNAVSVFQVGADRSLIFVQEFINDGGELKDFEGGNHLAVSPDGLNVYAAATRSHSIACFRRHPVSGRLTYLETIPDGGDAGSLGATATGVSPDGKFVYVSTEDEKSISVFARDSGSSPVKP